ncbi:NAD(P)-dependent oxidoreductase [Actinoallomurus iriomotensis]|uniref:NADH-flavin reductase n=1 Tax=Actinoallomurus iriomotensis TaxID=478107 RepID=A0A9W6RW68_9ACTN|nr:SDR family oxidoreductase [Actinoallomurus iriomotensis]GLY82753.1 NADH-flavin reductase [Actinoallomurus iriomotensis]
MRLTIFGATGGTGTQLVGQALEEGHDVTAVVRDPARLDVPAHERLRVVTADVTDAASVAPAVEGADAVLSVLGHRDRGPTTICRDAARAVIEAMGKAGVRRLVVCSAAGAFADGGDGLFTRYVVKPLILGPLLKNAFEDMRACEREVRDSALEWTLVRPPRLLDKEATGRYRTATDVNLRGGRTISRADLAACMLGVVGDDGSVRHHVSVAY